MSIHILPASSPQLRLVFVSLVFLAAPEGFAQQNASFREQQLRYPRVRQAAKEKDEMLRRRILGSHSNAGGDIFLHGNCVTIGCIPITDDGIKEAYWLAVLAHNEGQRHIPIEIFPARLSAQGLDALTKTHPSQSQLIAFWMNLQEGFSSFQKTHRAPFVSVAPDGTYNFGKEAHSARLDAAQ